MFVCVCGWGGGVQKGWAVGSGGRDLQGLSCQDPVRFCWEEPAGFELKCHWNWESSPSHGTVLESLSRPPTLLEHRHWRGGTGLDWTETSRGGTTDPIHRFCSASLSLGKLGKLPRAALMATMYLCSSEV